MKIFRFSVLFLLALASPLSGRSKEGGTKANIVDEGTFTILVGGRRIGTETFSIKQLPDFNIAWAEVNIEDGGNRSQQSSEFRVSSKGELQRYEWREIAPNKGEVVVEPQAEFLVEHIIPGDKGKKFDQPFLMPATTIVLDDYFFSQRELLVWRYLASVCKQGNGANKCASQKTEFGVIIPRQHSSSIVAMEYVGRDKISLHGSQAELSHFRLTSEDATVWELWLDEGQKLVRILIPAMNIEVLRD